jgi:hypothetical protein
MNLETYLMTVTQISVGVAWTALCVLVLVLACIYAVKVSVSLAKNADKNIERIRKVKMFKPRVIEKEVIKMKGAGRG